MILRKCMKCGSYSLKSACCSSPTVNPHPPKFSLNDKYARYRRMAKQKE